ncbi:MAG: Smr/MutS family protein [Bacteroidetes bacterium]|nr:Smr/MutS family protein [Bacteroidota bacterium]
MNYPIDHGASLTFFPVLQNTESAFLAERFSVYLKIGVPFAYSYSYSIKKKGQLLLSLTGNNSLSNEFYLHDILLEDLSDNPTFNLTISSLDSSLIYANQLSTTVRIKPRHLVEQLEKIHTKKVSNFSISVFDHYPKKEPVSSIPVFSTKPLASSISTSKKHQQDFIASFSHVVDLHIENLLTDWKGLSNFEILQIQLSHFEKMVERTIRNQHPTLVVIHGIGEGKLKNEIHQLLRQYKEVFSFDNQYHPRFGQGATTIQFQY